MLTRSDVSVAMSTTQLHTSSRCAMSTTQLHTSNRCPRTTWFKYLTGSVVMNTSQGEVQLFICKYHSIYSKYQFYCQTVLTHSSFKYIATSLINLFEIEELYTTSSRQVFKRNDITDSVNSNSSQILTEDALDLILAKACECNTKSHLTTIYL